MKKALLSFFLVIVMMFVSFPSAEGQYDTDRFMFRGRMALSEGKYAEAIDVFNILIRIDPEMYEAYFFRGIAKYNLEDFMGATSDFDKTLSMNPLYTPAYHYRAITYSRTGKYDEAIRDLDEAMDLRPGYTGLYFSRGVTYFLSGQFEAAVGDFNKFLKREPDVADAYLNRGASYLYLGDTLKALSDYNKAVSLNYFDPEGYIRRARVYILQDSTELALKDLDRALDLDSVNTFALFNRALVRYEESDFKGALSDLDRIIKEEPGNSLSLYNRALIRSQIGDYNKALDDYDRVIEINPSNVLAYFNRASVFVELSMYYDALEDYTKAIELYPDFAKAYMNRSYVYNVLGDLRASKRDYDVANAKISEYRRKMSDSTSAAAFADTSKAYSNLLSFDADFAKKDFNNELLQDKSVDIMLKPMYRFVPEQEDRLDLALVQKYESDEVSDFGKSLPFYVTLGTSMPDDVPLGAYSDSLDAIILRSNPSGRLDFAKAVVETEYKRYNSAISYYDAAIKREPSSVFCYFNRGAVYADMIEFISSLGSNVQILTMDNKGTTRARVSDNVTRTYDYGPAVRDMQKVTMMMPDFPYAYYNLGNLYVYSGEFTSAIEQYTKALSIYPSLAEAYYNRGLVLIFLKDREKGCMDISKAGELGITDAYPVIKKYCEVQQTR